MRYPEKAIITYDTKRQIDYCQACKKPECDNCLARLMVGQIPEDRMPKVTYPVKSYPCTGCPMQGSCTGNCRRLRSYRSWRKKQDKALEDPCPSCKRIGPNCYVKCKKRQAYKARRRKHGQAREPRRA